MDTLRYVAAGFLPSGGAEKPQKCPEPFKALPRRMAAKRQGKKRRSLIISS